MIEYHEFVAALRQFGPSDLSEAQIYDVMRALDINNDNCIEMYEFVKRFEVNDAQSCTSTLCLILQLIHMRTGFLPPRALDEPTGRRV